MNSPPLTVTAPQLRPPFGYLAIEGPIGVGKTSLARRLAERWSMQDAVRAAAGQSRFSNAFIATPRVMRCRRNCTSRCSARSRRRKWLAAHVAGTPLIADFMTQKNDIFARLTLQEDEWQLYRALAARLERQRARAGFRRLSASQS